MLLYDTIRPFEGEEVPKALKMLSVDPMFVGIVEKIYPQPGMKEQIIGLMNRITTVEEFQSALSYPLLEKIEKMSSDGLFYSAMEQFDHKKNYLFISNHRDIIIDPAFLNAIMHKNGFKKTEIAIGDNLLIYDWIKLLVRVNRCFIVKRNLGIKEQLYASKALSGYIRQTITQKGESIWIAQREGRTKDGNDQTQPALLKMLNMSNTLSIKEGFKELNIVPMAISYEIEPCGMSKVEELLNKKYIQGFAKTQQDDLKSMAQGVLNPKGRIHFGFGNPLNIAIDKLIEGKNDNETIVSIANYIDRRIYFNYKLWPNNYIAHDLLSGSEAYTSKYTSEEKEKFVAMMEQDLQKTAYDKTEARQMYLAMYANPLINYNKHFGA
jgi:hypothetical protein